MHQRNTFAAALTAMLLLGCPDQTERAQPPTAPSPPTDRSAASAPNATVVAAATAPTAEPAPAPPPAPPPPAVKLDQTRHFEVVDLHVDTPYQVVMKGRDLRLSEGHATPATLTQGHYGAIIYPIYIPDYLNQNNPRIADAERIFTTVHDLVNRHDMLDWAFVPGPEGLGRRAVSPDKVAVFVSIEGAGAFAADVEAIDSFIDRGVRLIGPVHAHDNRLATSATGQGSYGLTELGKQLCERIYARGALVDVSHMSDAAFADLVPIAARHDAPIVATHSNARALAPHKRNLTDEQLTIIGETGGVAGLNLYAPFVKASNPTLADVVAQVRHMVKVAGVDAVAIGSDFDGGTPVPALADAGRMPDLARALVADGMSEGDVRKVFGENALRILYWRQ